jgi:hypothetical protein
MEGEADHRDLTLCRGDQISSGGAERGIVDGMAPT